MSRALATVLSVVLVFGGVRIAHAQVVGGQEEPVIEACAGPEHRQFDFWVGDWEVTNPDGEKVGTNTITRVASGCALSEYWRSARGPTGTSLNWYEPTTGKWHQLWVGLGYYLRLSGGLQDGKMVLSGERETPDGTVIDRITWTRLESDRVHQLWEMSRDAGESWDVAFDGIYSRSQP